MRTYKQFMERAQKERRDIRPGDPDEFPFDSYLGITKIGDRYEVLVHPEDKWKDLSFSGACNTLCDFFTKYYSVIGRIDFNFSDDISEEEQKFVRRLCDIVRDRARFEQESIYEYNRAESLRPAATRAANAGLVDKFR